MDIIPVNLLEFIFYQTNVKWHMHKAKHALAHTAGCNQKTMSTNKGRQIIGKLQKYLANNTKSNCLNEILAQITLTQLNYRNTITSKVTRPI